VKDLKKVIALVGLVLLLAACGASVTEVSVDEQQEMATITSVERTGDDQFVLYRSNDTSLNVELFRSEGTFQVQSSNDEPEISIAIFQFYFEDGYHNENEEFEVHCSNAIICIGYARPLFDGVNAEVIVFGKPGAAVSFNFETNAHLPYVAPESLPLPRSGDLAIVTSGGEPMFVPRYGFAQVTVRMGGQYTGDYEVDWFDESNNPVVGCSDTFSEVGTLSFTVDIVNTCDRLIVGQWYTVRATSSGVFDEEQFVAGKNSEVTLNLRPFQLWTWQSVEANDDGFVYLINLGIVGDMDYSNLSFHSVTIKIETLGWEIGGYRFYHDTVESRWLNESEVEFVKLNNPNRQELDFELNIFPQNQNCKEGEVVEVNVLSRWTDSSGLLVYFDETIQHTFSCKG